LNIEGGSRDRNAEELRGCNPKCMTEKAEGFVTEDRVEQWGGMMGVRTQVMGGIDKVRKHWAQGWLLCGEKGKDRSLWIVPPYWLKGQGQATPLLTWVTCRHLITVRRL